MHNYRELNIWKNAMTIVKDVYKLTASLPNAETYGLISQMNRAVVSIPSNIAEGSSRSSNKEFKRFLEIALGSAFELETQLILCTDLFPETKNDIESIIENLDENQKMINGLILKFINA